MAPIDGCSAGLDGPANAEITGDMFARATDARVARNAALMTAMRRRPRAQPQDNGERRRDLGRTVRQPRAARAGQPARPMRRPLAGRPNGRRNHDARHVPASARSEHRMLARALMSGPPRTIQEASRGDQRETRGPAQTRDRVMFFSCPSNVADKLRSPRVSLSTRASSASSACSAACPQSHSAFGSPLAERQHSGQKSFSV